MPEFQMADKHAAVTVESDFVMGFIEAMFFTETSSIIKADFFSEESQLAISEGQESTLPEDSGYSDIHPDSLAAIRKFCEEKQAAMKDLLDRAYERKGYDENRAGNDLFYTYVGHGVGFWDRSELTRDGLGEALTQACGRGDVNAWFGNHVDYGDAPFVHVEL